MIGRPDLCRSANGETALDRRRHDVVRRFSERLALAAGAAVLVLGLTASAALAGEVTGSGANDHQNQGVSWCSFSGLNDDPNAPLDGSGPNGPGGQAQSFGQDVRLGLADPHEFNPGLACNPNKSAAFLPPQPNRNK